MRCLYSVRKKTGQNIRTDWSEPNHTGGTGGSTQYLQKGTISSVEVKDSSWLTFSCSGYFFCPLLLLLFNIFAKKAFVVKFCQAQAECHGLFPSFPLPCVTCHPPVSSCWCHRLCSVRIPDHSNHPVSEECSWLSDSERLTIKTVSVTEKSLLLRRTLCSSVWTQTENILTFNLCCVCMAVFISLLGSGLADISVIVFSEI